MRRRAGSNTVWRVALPLAATVLLAAGVAFYFGTGSQDDRAPRGNAARVVDPVGEVLAGGRRVLSGQLLAPGEALTTAEASAVTLSYPDGTIVTLRENTRLLLLQDPLAKRLSLRLGGLSAAVARQPAAAPMVVSTPHAEATVRGTRFTLAAELDSTRLEVADGSVEIEHLRTGEKAEVAAGHCALVAEGAPLLVRRLGEEKEPETEPGRGPNLVANPGFEDGAAGWVMMHLDKPTRTYTPVPQIEGLVVRTESRSGRSSLQLDRSLMARAVGEAGTVNQRVPFEPGVAYRAEVWIKCRDCRGAYMSLIWLDEKGDWDRWVRADDLRRIEGTRDWTRCSRLVTAPPRAKSLWVVLIPGTESGAAWFDDVYFAEKVEEPEPAVEKEKP